MDQSGYKKGGGGSDTTWDINYIRYIWVVSRAASQLCTTGRADFHLLNGCSLLGTKEHRPMICYWIVTLITISQQCRVLISPQCFSKATPSRQVELFTRGRNWIDTKPTIASVREAAISLQAGGRVGEKWGQEEGKKIKNLWKGYRLTEKASGQKYPNGTEFVGHARFIKMFFIKKRVKVENLFWFQNEQLPL